jgi:crossover junction endodeoxyribonuclease RuvC
MIVLGVDPGTRITGYGIVRKHLDSLVVIDYGCIRPPPDLPIAQKYLVLFEGIEKLIALHGIEVVAVETQFVQKNIQSALKLGMARASILLAAARAGKRIMEFAPRKAKQAILGRGGGGASKEQVQRMLQILLNLPELPQPEDAADGLMLAISALNACASQVVERV